MNSDRGIPTFAGRHTLTNKCKNGHESPLFAIYCPICGAEIDRIYDYKDWSGISLNPQQKWFLLKEWVESPNKVFFSYFDDRLIIFGSNGTALYLDSVLQNPRDAKNDKSFTLGAGLQGIDQIVSLYNNIYLLSHGHIWKISWYDLIAKKCAPVELQSPVTDFREIISVDNCVYTYSDSTIYRISQNQSLDQMFELPPQEIIISVSSSNGRLCILSRDLSQGNEQKIIAKIRTESYSDPTRLCEPLSVEHNIVQQIKGISASGNDYYSFSLGDEWVKIGKYSSLLTNSEFFYDINTGIELEHMFFLNNILYVYGDNKLKAWDCASFKYQPKGVVNTANLSSMKAFTSKIDKKIIIPIKQAQADFIGVYSAQLNQESISWGFHDELIALNVLDNHIFALFKTDNNLRLMKG